MICEKGKFTRKNLILCMCVYTCIHIFKTLLLTILLFYKRYFQKVCKSCRYKQFPTLYKSLTALSCRMHSSYSPLVLHGNKHNSLVLF